MAVNTLRSRIDVPSSLNFFWKKMRPAPNPSPPPTPLLLGPPRLIILYIVCYENFLFLPNFELFKMRFYF